MAVGELETLIKEELDLMLDETRGIGAMIVEEDVLVTPEDLIRKFPLSEGVEKNVLRFRREIRNVLNGMDNRLIVITGPCSIDNPKSALEYARRLKGLSEEYDDKILFVMRAYFEKPRTTVGWKGLLYDPEQDDSYEINRGLEVTRKLLLDIAELGIPVATEFLHPEVPYYIGDLVSWAAIGARTTESQIHREFASGLAMPVGFKNSTSGDIKVAVDAVVAAGHQQSYLGINKQGRIVNIRTNGNQDAHIILRGGNNGANYDRESVNNSGELLSKAGVFKNLIIDCSHANSGKDYKRQLDVFEDVINQRNSGNTNIVGVMLESYLEEGKGGKYGQSKTDGCISWKMTEDLIRTRFIKPDTYK